MARKLWASLLVNSGPFAHLDDEVTHDPHFLGEAVFYLVRRRKNPRGDTHLSYADLQNCLLRKKRQEVAGKEVWEIGAPRAVWDKAIKACIEMEKQFEEM